MGVTKPWKVRKSFVTGKLKRCDTVRRGKKKRGGGGGAIGKRRDRLLPIFSILS